MHEYELRLVVQQSVSFLPILLSYENVTEERVIYLKPHFRCRDKSWEKKRIVSVECVYLDHTWFKWVHSIEIPFTQWSTSTHSQFLHHMGNFQNPFRIEKRHSVQLDRHAKLYTFQYAVDAYRLVFEWEYGCFKSTQPNIDFQFLKEALSQYRSIYTFLRRFEPPPYTLEEDMYRKSVTTGTDCLNKRHFVYAHKLDGMFGIVYSYPDKIKEKWENYHRVIRHGITLGNGFAFAAEKLEDGTIFLLDVYQVRGHKTSSWTRKEILLDFLPTLSLPDGFKTQYYNTHFKSLPPFIPFKTDGYIAHNIMTDEIYKWKTYHSIDLMFHDGYFWASHFRIPSSEALENGNIYEVSTANGKTIRKRPDRFKSNTSEQIENELKHGWHGPNIEYFEE